MSETSVPRELRYTREHEWIRTEGETAILGITDYAQTELGEIVYVELPEVGAEFQQAHEMATIESVKAATELYCPLSGKIVESNEEVVDDPGLINRDPYGDGWMVKIRFSDPAELEDLLTAKDYSQLIEEEE